MVLFWPMVHTCKKCGDISEVTSGGRAEIENVKNDRPSDWQANLRQQMLLIKCHCTFYIYGPLGRKAFCRILKICFISWITSLNVQKLQIFAIFASYLASIVNMTIYPQNECYGSAFRFKECWALLINIWPWSFLITTGVRASWVLIVLRAYI